MMNRNLFSTLLLGLVWAHVSLANHRTGPHGSTYCHGCPHVNSLQNKLETCNIFTQDAVTMIDSSKLSIAAGFTKISGNKENYVSDGSIMSSIVFKFTNGARSVSYTAKDPASALADEFDDRSSKVLDEKTGDVWLQVESLNLGRKGESAIIITDYNSKSMMALHQKAGTKYDLYNLMLYPGRKTSKDAKGILVNGCPKEWVSVETPREAEWCKKVNGAKEPDLNDKVAQKMCNHDNGYDTDMAKSIYSFIDVANALSDLKDSWYKSGIWV